MTQHILRMHIKNTKNTTSTINYQKYTKNTEDVRRNKKHNRVPQNTTNIQ